MERMMNSRNGHRNLVQSKHENIKKVKMNCWKKLEGEEEKKEKKRKSSIISNKSKKNLHLKLQEVIDLY